MRVLNSISELPMLEGGYVTIGNFDGLHRGHQSIVEQLKKDAGDGAKVVITFRKAPVEHMNPAAFKGSILPDGFKQKLFREERMDYMVELDFPSVMGLTAREFLGQILARIRQPHLYVGYNFRFGKGNKGNADFLKKDAAENGYSASIIDKVYCRGALVSSTLIREEILKGNVHRAYALLGRPYFFVSTMETGDGLGKKMGFPTLNLRLTGQVLPEKGVYFTYFPSKGEFYPAMTYIGRRPTVGGTDTRIETHILDFEGEKDVFQPGRNYTVIFIRKIRGEKKFHNLEDLRKKMYNDRDTISAYDSAYDKDALRQKGLLYF